eukprot:GSChrysophyteH1.ASY1.ANO1.692.1 assembled CDS
MNTELLKDIKSALLKNGQQRSYDELLMLKSYLSGTDFVRNIVGNSLLPKQMDELCRNLVLESFNAGDVIIKQGEPGDRMYLVLKGLCEVRLKQNVELAHGLSEVREKALYECSQNMHFGEKALQNDEPRAASVVAMQYSDLISIHKFTYNSLIKSAIADAESIASRNDQPGTKAHCLKVLGKKSQFRTKLEIEAVAGYLDWRIPFFRKFTPEQQIELCRVSQAVSIYGETVLFKQGSIGQAFYIVLTGTVEVWVASVEEIAMQNAVAILSVGDTFGERALENEDSKRMASICTCESLTELLVIAREDYHKLVSALTNEELMYKITLLRKTDMFRNMDAEHLKELARYMVPRRYEVDDVLVTKGEKATEMVITDVGECALSEMRAVGAGKTMEVGRIAPHSVIAPYVTQVTSMYDNVYHPETIIANTLVTAYTVGLTDFFNNVNKESRKEIMEVVKNNSPCTIPGLWETQALRFGDREWRVKAAWEKYRANVRNPARAITYLESLKSLSNMHLTIDSGNVFQDTNDINWGRFELSNTARKQMDFRIDSDYDRSCTHPVVEKALSATEEREKRRQREAALLAEEQAATFQKAEATSSRSEAPTPDELMAQWLDKKILEPEETPVSYAFSLVHIHQKRMRPSPASVGAQRMLKTYMRLCGALPSCSHAKQAAETQMQSALLMQYDSDLSKSEQLRLNWRAFSSFESMPLLNSDIFVVYCRSVPVEYACISPEKDLMEFVFPSFCKQKNQFYSCCIVKGLTPPDVPLPPNNTRRKTRRRAPPKEDVTGIMYEGTDDEGSDDEFVRIERQDAIEAAGLPASSAYKLDKFNMQLTQPVFLQELCCFTETLACASTQRACLLYGKTTQSKMASLDPLQATYDPLSAEMAMTAPGIGLARVSSATTSSQGNRSNRSTSPNKTATASKLTSADKIICVFPLYEWLPISEAIMKEYNIVNICNVDSRAKELAYGMTDFHATGFTASTSASTRNAGAATFEYTGNVTLKGPDSLDKSFKEAGMTSPPRDNVLANSKSLSDLPFLDEVALQVTRRGLAKSVSIEHIKSEAKEAAETRRMKEELHKKRIHEMRPENRKAAVQKILQQQMTNVAPASVAEKQSKDTMSFIETEEKKVSLHSVIHDRKRMISLNDKLCFDEGKLKGKSKRGRKSYNPNNLGGDADSDDEANVGDFSILEESPNTSDLQSSGVHTAGKVDMHTYKRGVTLAKSQTGGTLGPGGMGLLRQRMNMYESLNQLAPHRRVVEETLLKKKELKEQREEEKQRRAKPISSPVAEEKRPDISATIDTLTAIMNESKHLY